MKVWQRVGWRIWQRIDWRSVPWSLWGFCILSLVGTIRIETGHLRLELRLFTVAFTLVWTYFLLAGVQWLWIVTVAFGVLGLALDPILGTTLYGLASSLVSLVLLLLPATRRYFGRGDPASAPG